MKWKTTLIKILTGILRQSKGEILIDGEKQCIYKIYCFLFTR